MTEAPRSNASAAMATMGVTPDPAAISRTEDSPPETKRPSGGIASTVSPGRSACANSENAPPGTWRTPMQRPCPGAEAIE